jgi:putative restriction endonuclease
MTKTAAWRTRTSLDSARETSTVDTVVEAIGMGAVDRLLFAPHVTDVLDTQVRLAAFRFLDKQVAIHGEVLPWSVLSREFRFNGERVPLISQQGIFKPKVLPDVPISIRTAPVIEGQERPYEDEFSPDGLIRYCYRGIDPTHRDNVGLRLAMQRRTPLIYFVGIVEGQYMTVWPVYIVAENRDPLRPSFSVAVDDPGVLMETPDPTAGIILEADAGRRAYITATVRRRVHQRSFRERVIRAYQRTCAVCRLRHEELLDAAHIIPDTKPHGLPVVRNGLALCKLHHAAFDSNILGIRPDLGIEIRLDVLEETDGPMLEHGLQGFQSKRIVVPHRAELKPDPAFLEERYEMFRA